MKKQKRWKPGGRPRQKSNSKKWLLKRDESLDGNDKKDLEHPLIVPRIRKRGE